MEHLLYIVLGLGVLAFVAIFAITLIIISGMVEGLSTPARIGASAVLIPQIAAFLHVSEGYIPFTEHLTLCSVVYGMAWTLYGLYRLLSWAREWAWVCKTLQVFLVAFSVLAVIYILHAAGRFVWSNL